MVKVRHLLRRVEALGARYGNDIPEYIFATNGREELFLVFNLIWPALKARTGALRLIGSVLSDSTAKPSWPLSGWLA